MKVIERKLWTEEVISTQEDSKLCEIVLKNGPKNWPVISSTLSTVLNKSRSAKQCRERWCNYLDPSVKQSDWPVEDQNKVFEYNSTFGNKWSAIAALIPGRSENSVKNFYYSTVRKNIRRVNKLKIFPNDISGKIDDLKKDGFLRLLLFCNSKECLKRAKKYKRVLGAMSRNSNEVSQEIGINEWIEECNKFILSLFGIGVNFSNFY